MSWFGLLKTEQIPPASEPNRLDSIDHEKFSQSIISQIKQAGLPEPKNPNLFPAEPGPFGRASKAVDEALHGHSLSLMQEGRGGGDTINGVTADKMDHIVSAAFPNMHCDCFLHRHPEANKIFAALHETGHYIDANLGLTENILKSRSPDLAKNPDFATNIRERIADGTATIYLLSNYGDNPQTLALIKSYRDLREANSKDPLHFTSDSIDRTIELFRKNPRQNMSVVESAKMAADTILTQPGLEQSFKIAKAATNLEAAANAKNRFCTPN